VHSLGGEVAFFQDLKVTGTEPLALGFRLSLGLGSASDSPCRSCSCRRTKPAISPIRQPQQPLAMGPPPYSLDQRWSQTLARRAATRSSRQEADHRPCGAWHSNGDSSGRQTVLDAQSLGWRSAPVERVDRDRGWQRSWNRHRSRDIHVVEDVALRWNRKVEFVHRAVACVHSRRTARF